MSDVRNKKMDTAINDLLSRQDYLVTQANELARSFGNLKTFEHKVLDYCFSFVEKEDLKDKDYTLVVSDILRHFGLNLSGKNYNRVLLAFKKLNENTAIYMQITRNDGKKAVIMTSLFDHITVVEDGVIEFSFSSKVAPYVFELKKNFYSFKLSELGKIKSKYTISLLKLWNANAFGKWRNYNDPNSLPPSVTIQGTLEDWQSWFLGSDENGKPKRWPAGRFKQKTIDVAVKELSEIYPKTLITVTTMKHGRRVTGYTLDIYSVNTHLNITSTTTD